MKEIIFPGRGRSGRRSAREMIEREREWRSRASRMKTKRGGGREGEGKRRINEEEATFARDGRTASRNGVPDIE